MLGAAVSQLLAERGLVLRVNRPLAPIDGAARELVFQDGGNVRIGEVKGLQEGEKAYVHESME